MVQRGGSGPSASTSQGAVEAVTGGSLRRTISKEGSDRTSAAHCIMPLSLTRSGIRSKLRRRNSKRHRLTFQRVFGSLFRSSENNVVPLGPSVATRSRTNSESVLGHTVELNPSMSIDILFPPAFTFSSPMLQPSSATPSASSTSRASPSQRPRSQADHTRWSFVRGGSSFFGSPDGSNDESPLKNNSSDFLLEHQQGPISRNLSRAIPSSESRSDLRCFLAQQASASESWRDQSLDPCYPSSSTDIHLGHECTRSKTSLIESETLDITPAPWLPLELLHQIFRYLHPADFNAARHVCRRWMLASLDSRILCAMLRRSGWSVLAGDNIIDENDSLHGDITLELRLSSALARACALGPDWTGSGVHFSSEGAIDSIQPALRKSALVKTSDMDFTELSSGSQGDSQNRVSGLLFTVSACGRFLLVADGSIIYVYQLGPGYDLELAVRIACPRRVIGVSMDTTCGRYAVAAFLDGRVGMVCDLQLNKFTTPHSPEYAHDGLSRHSTHCSLIHDGDSSDESVNANDSRSSSPVAFISAEDSSPRKRTISLLANEIPLSEDQRVFQGSSHQKQYANAEQRSFKRSLKAACRSACPTLIPNKRTTYQDLCYPDDPPRTVAICPSRSCAAFGCNAGIQLHWIDVVTKRQEDRFFPLSATTDVLYFLPPRAGIDAPPSGTNHVIDVQSGPEARRLRLIGSAVAPRHGVFLGRTELSRRMFGAKSKRIKSQRKHGKHRSTSSPNEIPTVGVETPDQIKTSHDRLQSDWSLAELEGSIKQKIRGEPSPFRPSRESDQDVSLADMWHKWASGYNRDKKASRQNFDHYRAVPLSDGHHILFTDPSTGLLCLGCDAPFARPIKLTRKIVLEPPFPQGRTASTEQTWRKSMESKARKGKAKEKRPSSSDPLTHSEDEGSFRQHVSENSDVTLFPTIYTVGTNLENGVFVAAGYEENLVLFTVPPDIFAVSQRELQPSKDEKNEAGHDWLHRSTGSTSSARESPDAESSSRSTTAPTRNEQDAMQWLEYWRDTVTWSIAASVAGATRADPGSAPDGPGFFNSPPLTGPTKPGIWPLKVRGTLLGTVPMLVDIAVRNENGELVVWAFSADGHAYIFEVDSVRVELDGNIPLKRKSVTRDGEVVGSEHDEASSWQVEESNADESLALDGCPSDISGWLQKAGRTTSQETNFTTDFWRRRVVDADGAVDTSSPSRRRHPNETLNFTDNLSNGSTLASTSTLIPEPVGSNTSPCPLPSQPSSPPLKRSLDPCASEVAAAASSTHPSSSSWTPPPPSAPSSHLASNSLTDTASHQQQPSIVAPPARRTHDFRPTTTTRASARAWQTDLDDVPYEVMMGDGHPSDIGHWAGYRSGRLASFRPAPEPDSGGDYTGGRRQCRFCGGGLRDEEEFEHRLMRGGLESGKEGDGSSRRRNPWVETRWMEEGRAWQYEDQDDEEEEDFEYEYECGEEEMV